MSTEDLFYECFAGWKKDVDRIEPIGTQDIYVFMKSGKVYQFGTKEKSEIHLETVQPSQKTHVP